MLISRERSRDPLWIRTSPKDRYSHTWSGLLLALNTAPLPTVAVELVDAQEGLGAVIWFAWDALQTDEPYAASAITDTLGMGSNYLLQRLTCRLVPWQTKRGYIARLPCPIPFEARGEVISSPECLSAVP